MFDLHDRTALVTGQRRCHHHLIPARAVAYADAVAFAVGGGPSSPHEPDRGCGGSMAQMAIAATFIVVLPTVFCLLWLLTR